MAFNKRARDAIRRRADWVSEISGVSSLIMHCAHIDHSKDSQNYNSPYNGVYMTIKEHYIDHVLREGVNGLTKAQNYMAIESLSRQLVKHYPKGVRRVLLAYINARNAKEKWIAKIQAIQEKSLTRV